MNRKSENQGEKSEKKCLKNKNEKKFSGNFNNCFFFFFGIGNKKFPLENSKKN